MGTRITNIVDVNQTDYCQVWFT